MSAPLLSVKDLRVTFPIGGALARLRGAATEIEGVAGVSFEVAKGETFALVGESGSGKTTLARTLNGLQKVASGSIQFAGADVTRMGRAEMKALRRRVPMMFQDPVGSLSPRLDVRALLAEPFRIHGMSNRDLDAEVRRLL